MLSAIDYLYWCVEFLSSTFAGKSDVWVLSMPSIWDNVQLDEYHHTFIRRYLLALQVS